MKVRDWGIDLQHWFSAQCWADNINMWPNAVLSFNYHLGIQIVCLGYLWILRNVDKKCCFFNLKILKKNEIMIYGIHCFIQNKIPKNDVIPRRPCNVAMRTMIIENGGNDVRFALCSAYWECLMALTQRFIKQEVIVFTMPGGYMT